MLFAGLVAACDIKLSDRKKHGPGHQHSADEANLVFDPHDMELSDHTFDLRVINSDDPWLIFFYSPQCGTC